MECACVNNKMTNIQILNVIRQERTVTTQFQGITIPEFSGPASKSPVFIGDGDL
jgi:hypothetical protein